MIEFIFGKELCDMYISRLLELSWTILVSDDNIQFMISDHPVQNLSSSDNELHGQDMSSENIEILFPLTTKYALVLNDKRGENRNYLEDFNIYKISKEYVEEYNRLQVIRANRYVVSNIDIDEFCSKIMKNKSNIPSALIIDKGDGYLSGGLVAVDGRYKYILIDKEVSPDND